MRVKPILFNTNDVRAILDDRKTVTRRIVKPMPHCTLPIDSRCWECNGDVGKLCNKADLEFPEPPYQPDDVIYARETWVRLNCCSCEGDNQGNCFAKPDKNEGCYVYRATHEIYGDIKWHPSIHMPKDAARIWLQVTDVGVERLQDINYFGCINEGIPYRQYEKDIIKDFSALWDSTIKKSDLDRYGWEANPFVWVIAFERCEKPESEMEK